MRILVTGAAGFIGSHVAEAYAAAGHEVLGLDNLSTGSLENVTDTFEFHKIDILEQSTFEKIFQKFRPEVVNHHAAQVNVRRSWQDPLADAQSNILGSLAVLKQMVRWKTRKIIYSSSGGAIHGQTPSLPVNEDTSVQPASPYGVSKFTSELYIHAYHAGHGLAYCILRYPNVYGPRQSPKGEAGVVAIFSAGMLMGRPVQIFGGGTKTRDYVYVADIVEANKLALDYDESDTFTFGSCTQLSDFEVFETIRDAMGANILPTYVENPRGEVEHIYLSSAKAERLLGWVPRTTFCEGVKMVVDEWKNRLDPSHQ